MPRSWIERLRRWFHTDSPSSASFDPKTFERLCKEDPASAREVLVADQHALAEELERTYAAYDERLEGLAERLSSMKPEDVEREARVLREAQDSLRRMLRRIDASAQTARQLERELGDWEARGDQEGPWHADHPNVRAEIIRSELAARDGFRGPVAIAPEQSPFRITESVSIDVGTNPGLALPAVSSSAEEEPFESLHDGNPEQILQLIRMETREAERWHGQPTHDQDAIEQVKTVKHLHAILKRLDREQGIRRDRLVFAIHTRDLH
ncbi:MAG: hypothetical protein WC787_05270 [Patescibacteria group bacterium]|jgi:hypothetical protein